MSILGSIISSIFGTPAHAEEAPKPTAGGAAPSPTAVASAATAGTPSPAAAGAAGGTAKPTVDVAAVLDKLADASDEDLDWRKSIVDLMKLLKLDSSLSARRQLAQELHYSGDGKDTAAMNIWLHRQVMTKLAENGGVVPADLKH